MLSRIVDLARLAPSVHNAQPWFWVIDGTTLELWADRGRALPVSDPLDRNLVISCGCALQHTVVATEAVGAEAKIDFLPEGPDSDLMARIDVVRSMSPREAGEALVLLLDRHTDRRRFTAWPVPEDNLQRLREAGRSWGAEVTALTDTEQRRRVEELLEDARRHQMADPRIADETEGWIDHGEHDGIPAATLPQLHGVRGERASRFGSGLIPNDADSVVQGTDRILVISTPDDGPLSWLRAGAALSALWLRATGDGLSLVPLSQLVEVERTRVALEQMLPEHARAPQVLARVGWQQIGRDQLPRTPRRPLDDVIRSRPA